MVQDNDIKFYKVVYAVRKEHINTKKNFFGKDVVTEKSVDYTFYRVYRNNVVEIGKSFSLKVDMLKHILRTQHNVTCDSIVIL